MTAASPHRAGQLNNITSFPCLRVKALDFTVFFHDVRNPYSNVAGRVVRRTSTFRILSTSIETKATCYVQIYTERTGLHVVSFKHFTQETFTVFYAAVLAAETSPMHCTIEGEASRFGNAGEQEKFDIVARDRFGNARLRGGEDFAVIVRPNSTIWDTNTNNNMPPPLRAAVVSFGNSTYAVLYSITVAGRYSIEVFYDASESPGFGERETQGGILVTAFPLPLNLLSGKVDISRTTVTGRGASMAVAGYPSFFTVAVSIATQIRHCCPFLSL